MLPGPLTNHVPKRVPTVAVGCQAAGAAGVPVLGLRAQRGHQHVQRRVDELVPLPEVVVLPGLVHDVRDDAVQLGAERVVRRLVR